MQRENLSTGLWNVGLYGTMPYMNRPKLSEKEDRTRRVFKLLMQSLHYTDHEVGARLGVSRQSIQQRRQGTTRIRLGDVDDLARALGVDPKVFGMEPEEALQHVLANSPDLLIRTLRCLTAHLQAVG